jgi:hypothetical protein
LNPVLSPASTAPLTTQSFAPLECRRCPSFAPPDCAPGERYFEPNQTLMIQVELQRHVVEGVFQLTKNLPPEDFKNQSKGAELP